MNAYLPHTQRFPGGYIITIKAVAPATLRTDAFGLWDGSARTILVDKTQDELRQKYTLVHELSHGFTDWSHIYLGLDTPEGIGCRHCPHCHKKS